MSDTVEQRPLERPVMRNGERRECVILMHDGATALAKWNEHTSRWMFAQPYFGLEIGHGAVKAWRYVDDIFDLGKCMGWQPIETAPKTDDEDILLIDKRGTQVVGGWNEKEGEFTCDYRGEGNFNWVFATHWKHLTEPPSDA